MKTFALAAIIASASAMSQIESEFLGFITKFGKSYKSMAEYEMRLTNFAINHSVIHAHNATESSYKLGLNKMSDWTEEEYKNILTYKSEGEKTIVDAEVNPLGYSPVNWVTEGCISPIKDQGQCGSCWAFSTQAMMENASCISTQKLQSFSEQELVDCVKLCNGCNGGLQSYAFRYLETHAEMSEASYGYTAKDGTCKYSSSSNTGVNCTGWANVTPGSPDAMKAQLAKSALAVAIQADKRVFQSYTSGVFTSTSCGTTLDHATNVVGWGTESGMDYWLMRNSWGTSWGEAGYMKLEIVSGNGICGIQMDPQYATAN
jgi:C1A family cysteine protease